MHAHTHDRLMAHARLAKNLGETIHLEWLSDGLLKDIGWERRSEVGFYWLGRNAAHHGRIVLKALAGGQES